MPPIDRNDLEAALVKKGFTFKQGDHRFYYLYVDGKKTSIRTKVSMGTSFKQYNDTLLSLVAKQLKMTKKQLLEFIECNLSYDDYVDHLKSINVI